jgi:hypothetical protein
MREEWKVDPMLISPSQELFLKMLEMTSFNNFDGPRIAQGLRDNRELWRSFVFTNHGPLALLILRDLPDDAIAYDTLFLLASPSRQDQLHQLVSQWDPDELSWTGAEEARRMLGGRRAVAEFETDPERVILRAWWD